jgi:hypothetical protein
MLGLFEDRQPAPSDDLVDLHQLGIEVIQFTRERPDIVATESPADFEPVGSSCQALCIPVTGENAWARQAVLADRIAEVRDESLAADPMPSAQGDEADGSRLDGVLHWIDPPRSRPPV